MASCVITGHLVAALCRTAEFRSGDYALLMGKGREKIQRQHAEAAETTLGEARDASSNPDSRRLGSIERIGACLSVPPSNVNGTELWAQERRASLYLRYGIHPPDLSSHCDGFGTALSI